MTNDHDESMSEALRQAHAHGYAEDDVDRVFRLQQQQVDETLDSLRAVHAVTSERLRGLFGPAAVIDEIALMFNDEKSLTEFVRSAVCNHGYDLFNTANDVVETWPIRNMYRVSYWFLSTPHGYRLELMTASTGSPLHDAISQRMSEASAAAVHASFKVDNEVDYAIVNGTLLNEGYEMAQRCQSSYGRFAYWTRTGREEGVELYLKPRLNTRDAPDEDAYSDDELEALDSEGTYTDTDAAKDVEALGGHDA